MFERLVETEKRFEELTKKLADPAVIADQNEWRKSVKEHAALQDLVECYRAYRKLSAEIAEYRELMDGSDADMKQLAADELGPALQKMEALQEELKKLMLPKDPDDDKNVVMEIRAGAGGDEAALFGTQLMRMYMRFAERNRWKIKEIDMNFTDLGGVKEVVFTILGKDAYSKLKYESGVHRVQRVPATESQGRVHTSTVTVAVLPEVEDIEIEILDKDLKIDTYRSGGAGGQHVNKTESAIRITHLPTGIVVTCQDEKSQIKNREAAMKVLKSRLYNHFRTEADEAYAANRKMQIGTGDRSERIRTYNFPQGRVTDHRIGMTIYSLDEFLDGDIYGMIEALALEAQNKLLGSIQE